MEVRDARFSYDGHRKIFSDLSFVLAPDEWLCLLGPNGSGKTTLLKCLCRLLRLQSGQILLNHKNINTISREDLGKMVGYIPQMHQLSIPYSTTDIVLMGRTPHKGLFEGPSERDYEIAYQAMDSVGILSIKDELYTHLSGGQIQLVTIARALAQESKILLLDEPTSHLDLPNQAYILRLLKRLSEQGISIIMTSHYPDHAFFTSGNVGLLNQGKLLAYGPAESILTESNLNLTYGIDIKILNLENDINRKICIPVLRV